LIVYIFKLIHFKVLISVLFYREKSEFILVAQKERILRLSGNLPYEVLPVRKLENVIAVEFDVKNNCVFWADIVTDTIGV